MQIKEIEFTPELLRELQLIQLECLIELDRICRKHGIEYSIDGGTLLGAVRHKGFIPWDGDIDVIFSRIEYEKFYMACKADLDDSRFFLQEKRNDKNYRVYYPRIRRKNTTYIRAGQEKFKHQTGVMIDVFVLDKVPDAIWLRYLHKFVRFCLRKILWSKSGMIVDKNPLMRIGYALMSLIPKKFPFWALDTLAKKCNKMPKSELVCHYATRYPRPEINKFGTPSCLTNSGFTELEFEGHMFKAVCEYDAYLTALYGDYMVLPSLEERKPHIHLSAFSGVAKGSDGDRKHN